MSQHTIKPRYSSIFYALTRNIVVAIPFISVAVTGWQLASGTFAGHNKSFRRKQQWKSFLLALINPRFASQWFEILRSSDIHIVAKHRRRLYLKPFRPYMSMRWTKKQKVKVILDTYRFIMSKGEEFRRVITCSEGVEIARFNLSETTEGFLTLGYDEKFRKEGEFVLSFKCDALEGIIIAASFSFEEMESGRWASRIGCIQGYSGNADLSRAAQKLLCGLRPKSLLIFALQEFSRELGMTAIYGAGDKIQVYRGKHLIHLPWRHVISFDYNSIWCESGGKLHNNGWYELPLTPDRRKLTEIKANKRSLYQRRYQMLQNLTVKIADTVNTISR